MIVADASVLIAHLDARDPHHETATGILGDAVADPLAASSITLAEVLVGPARGGRVEEALAALQAIGVGEVELGPGAAPRLAALRAETGLKLPDCCVVLAAERTGAKRLLSLDRRLVAAARQRGLA